ncbi:MAG TPA: hypothetical protein VHT92_02805 [Candidatus Cybelea sp.]|nr:hypothetical protein [Candidatus Cybelea sp.]
MRVSSPDGGESASVQRGDDRTRYLTLFWVTAPSAAIVWYVFHTVYENLSASVKAVGYVDSMTQVGIGLGYVAMVGGTLVLAGIALWSGIAYLVLLRRGR